MNTIILTIPKARIPASPAVSVTSTGTIDHPVRGRQTTARWVVTVNGRTYSTSVMDSEESITLSSANGEQMCEDLESVGIPANSCKAYYPAYDGDDD